MYKSNTCIIILAIYVDILLTINDFDRILETKKYLLSQFSLKDLGKLKYFLENEIAYRGSIL